MRKYWPMLLLMALVTIAAVPAFQDFCVTQFGISGNKVAIKSGALTTNFSARVLNSLAGFTNYGDVQLKSANGSSDILRVDGTEQEITFQQGLPFFSQATANRIAVFSGSKQLSSSIAVSDTEASYLAGVTSAIQTQLDGKPSNANLNNASNLFIKVNGGGGTNNPMTNSTLYNPAVVGTYTGGSISLATGSVSTASLNIGGSGNGQLALSNSVTVKTWTQLASGMNSNVTTLSPSNALPGVVVNYNEGAGTNRPVSIPLPSDATKYLDGTGAFSTPAGGSGTNQVVQTNGVNVGQVGTVNWGNGITGGVAGTVAHLGVNLAQASGTNAIVMTNGVAVGQVGTINFVDGGNTTVTGVLAGATAKIGITSSAGGGTVTSVGLSMPSTFSVSGSPVTTSGTLAASYSPPAIASHAGYFAMPISATGGVVNFTPMGGWGPRAIFAFRPIAANSYSQFGYSGLAAQINASLVTATTSAFTGNRLATGTTAGNTNFLSDQSVFYVPVTKGGIWKAVVALTNLTSARYLVGLTGSSGLNTINDGETIGARHVALIKFSTNSANYFLVTGNGSSTEQSDTGIAATTSVTDISLVFNATNNVLASVVAVINGVACATNTTKLPAAVQQPLLAVTTLEAVAKAIDNYGSYAEFNWP